MNFLKLLTKLLIAGLAGFGYILLYTPGISICADTVDTGIIVHFAKNKSQLSYDDKTKIRNRLKNVKFASGARIMVAGYTDSTGIREYNYKLSRKRARIVKKEIISSFGVSPDLIIAVGVGPENPVATNKTKKGQALNRRTEIKFWGVPPSALQKKYGVVTPKQARLDEFILQAKNFVKAGELDKAVEKIKQAENLGGQQYSDWHAIYGIIGFYSGISEEIIKPHFKIALALDPYNFIARDFLGRVEARINFKKGQVLATNGQTLQHPIKVTTISQEHEYLRLFKVEPLRSNQLEIKPIDCWVGLTRHNQEITYYFDFSQIYEWAY